MQMSGPRGNCITGRSDENIKDVPPGEESTCKGAMG